jgi:hypothetical protein
MTARPFATDGRESKSGSGDQTISVNQLAAHRRYVGTMGKNID